MQNINFLKLTLFAGIGIAFGVMTTTLLTPPTSQIAQLQELVTLDDVVGSAAAQDNFPVNLVDDDKGTPTVLGAESDGSLVHRYASIELPLQKADYYDGKYTNAKAAANEINATHELSPGDNVRLIKDGYVTGWASRGYVRSTSDYFGSGMCWSVTALGGLLDISNRQFSQKYGIPMFVFTPGERAPHPHTYATYRPVNGGKGYTVLRTRQLMQDFSFRLNPAISQIHGLEDLKVEVVVTATAGNPHAYRGQSIGAYLVTNKSFLTHNYNNGELGPAWDGVRQAIQDKLK